MPACVVPAFAATHAALLASLFLCHKSCVRLLSSFPFSPPALQPTHTHFLPPIQSLRILFAKAAPARPARLSLYPHIREELLSFLGVLLF